MGSLFSTQQHHWDLGIATGQSAFLNTDNEPLSSEFVCFCYWVCQQHSTRLSCKAGLWKVYLHASDLIFLQVYFIWTCVFIYVLWSTWIRDDSNILTVSLLLITENIQSTLVFGFLEGTGEVLASPYCLFSPLSISGLLYDFIIDIIYTLNSK